MLRCLDELSAVGQSLVALFAYKQKNETDHEFGVSDESKKVQGGGSDSVEQVTESDAQVLSMSQNFL